MKSDDRKKQILDCAKQVFSEKGYYDAQVEDIIKTAKIGKGTLYEYFRNKEDLFLSLLERFVQEWELEITSRIEDTELSGPFTHPAVNYVYRIIFKTIDFIQRDPERGKIILRMGPGLNIEIEPYIERFESKIISQIIDGIKLGQKFKNIKQDADKDVMANFLLGAVLRVAYNSLLLESDGKNAPDIAHLSKDITEIIHKGIFSFRKKDVSEKQIHAD